MTAVRLLRTVALVLIPTLCFTAMNRRNFFIFYCLFYGLVLLLLFAHYAGSDERWAIWALFISLAGLLILALFCLAYYAAWLVKLVAGKPEARSGKLVVLSLLLLVPLAIGPEDTNHEEWANYIHNDLDYEGQLLMGDRFFARSPRQGDMQRIAPGDLLVFRNNKGTLLRRAASSDLQKADAIDAIEAIPTFIYYSRDFGQIGRSVN